MGDMVPKHNYKVTPEHKKLILQHAIAGMTCKESTQILLEEYGLSLSIQAVWDLRNKNAKRIARAMDHELDMAIATSPLTTLAHRLTVYERVIQEGFDDFDQAKKELSSDEDLNPEQESFIRLKGIRSLQAVNDAVKNAGTDVMRVRGLDQKLREYNAKNNLGTRDLVEETILTVSKRVFAAQEKSANRQEDMAELMGEVEWIEDGDIE